MSSLRKRYQLTRKFDLILIGESQSLYRPGKIAINDTPAILPDLWTTSDRTSTVQLFTIWKQIIDGCLNEIGTRMFILKIMIRFGIQNNSTFQNIKDRILNLECNP